MLTTCSVPSFDMYKTNMENEKNNVTSRYAETYTTINCKTYSTASQRLIQTASGRCPGGIRTAPGGVRTIPDGF